MSSSLSSEQPKRVQIFALPSRPTFASASLVRNLRLVSSKRDQQKVEVTSRSRSWLESERGRASKQTNGETREPRSEREIWNVVVVMVVYCAFVWQNGAHFAYWRLVGWLAPV